MRRTPYVCACLTAAVALLVLVGGWCLDVEVLRSIAPGTVSMKAPTAVLFLLSSGALALMAGRPSGRRRWLARGLAVLVIAIAAAFLAEYVFHVSLGIDERPFRDEVSRLQGAAYPGRPSPLAMVSFVLVAVALMTLDTRRRLAELLVVPVVMIAATSLIGYLYSIPAFYGPASATKMAINTAALFLALSVAIVLARPRGALQRLLTTNAPGGIMMRKLLPIALAVPLLLGWLRLVAHDAGLFGLRTGTWWLTAATIVCLTLVVVVAASSVDRAVRRAERQFETAFELAPIGVAIVRLDGHLIMANRALSRITGYTRHDLVDKRADELFHEDDRDGYEAARAQVLGGGPYTADRRYRRADGAVIWARHSAALVRDDDGRPQHIIAQVQDITTERADASALALAKDDLETRFERLQELDRMKEEFVSLVTHELRTPLTSVAGYLDLLLDDEDGDDDAARLDPGHARHAQVARRNAQRLIDLVEDLLFVRRLEAGREELDPIALDLSELAADRVESIAPLASAKDIAIDGDVAAGVIVDADPRRMAQILDNLLSNAIKYTPEGGRVRLDLASRHDRVELAVHDTGIGIPAAEQASLFEPFFRASNVAHGTEQGTGLGLVVTRRLVEAHGGTIDVASGEGRGSSFTVTLPAACEVTAPARGDAARAA
jgi:PAS domain S-box-containing protein